MKLTPKICYNCGKKMHTANQYIRHDEFLGTFSIPCKHEEYSFCDCGEERLAYSLCLRIEQEEQNRISQAIMNLAHNNLRELEELVVTSRDLESIMNVSRQAISKNGKLKTLVYHITFKGKMYYLKKSVKLFKETGDGRFDLSPHINETTTATTMDATMEDVTWEEPTSHWAGLTPNSRYVLPQNTPESHYWGEYKDALCIQSSLIMKPPSRQYARFNTDTNGQNTSMSTNSLLIDETTLALAKAQSINTYLFYLTNKGEK